MLYPFHCEDTICKNCSKIIIISTTTNKRQKKITKKRFVQHDFTIENKIMTIKTFETKAVLHNVYQILPRAADFFSVSWSKDPRNASLTCCFSVAV